MIGQDEGLTGLTHFEQDLVCAFVKEAFWEAGRSRVLFANRGELRVDPPADLHEQNRRGTLHTHTRKSSCICKKYIQTL